MAHQRGKERCDGTGWAPLLLVDWFLATSTSWMDTLKVNFRLACGSPNTLMGICYVENGRRPPSILTLEASVNFAALSFSLSKYHSLLIRSAVRGGSLHIFSGSSSTLLQCVCLPGARKVFATCTGGSGRASVSTSGSVSCMIDLSGVRICVLLILQLDTADLSEAHVRVWTSIKAEYGRRSYDPTTV